MDELKAYAIAKSIWRQIRRADGYQPYGYDWNTLRLTHPQACATLQECYRALGQL